jgi:hypothetical protein
LKLSNNKFGFPVVLKNEAMVSYISCVLKSLLRLPAFCLITITLQSCSGQNGKAFLPDVPGFTNETRQTFVLHKQLLEISGITYVNERTLAAINDEDGKVFKVDFGDGKPASVDFGKGRDYEDIVLLDSNYYVLESNGNINIVPLDNPSQSQRVLFPKKKKIEFESLYLDKTINKLVLLSKEQRMIDEALVAYSFDPDSQTFSTEPYFITPLKAIKRLMKDYSAECKPSAASVHPILNKLFIVASVGKVLVICSLTGEVESVYYLNPDVFSQPEGICFSPQGDMFISNEGLNGKATILKFAYKQAR